jgi:hypothetical protein
MDGTLTIYRIECPLTHVGPYNNPERMEDPVINAAYHAIPCPRPAPYEDGYSMKRDDRSGFDNLADLLWWFAGSFSKLHAAGYMVAQYAVPEGAVERLTRQVAFDSRHAELIDRDLIPKVCES